MPDKQYIWVLTDGESFTDCKIRTEAEAEELHLEAKRATNGNWWWIRIDLPKSQEETIADSSDFFGKIQEDEDLKNLSYSALGGIMFGFFLGRGIPMDEAKKIIYGAGTIQDVKVN